jgi:hypothetical protein
MKINEKLEEDLNERGINYLKVCIVTFYILYLMDIVTTIINYIKYGAFREANPICRFFLVNFGWYGFFVFKILLIIIFISAINNKDRPKVIDLIAFIFVDIIYLVVQILNTLSIFGG